MAQYLVPQAGLQWLQDNDLASTTLYLLLIDADGFTALGETDTMASHAGWTELADYSESVRQTWNHLGTSAGIMSNPAGANFTCNAAASAIGWALVSDSTKRGTSGTLLVIVLNDSEVERVGGETWTVIHKMIYRSGG